MKINKFDQYFTLEGYNHATIISDIFNVIDRLTDYTDNVELDIILGFFKYNEEGVGCIDNTFVLTNRFVNDPNFYIQMFNDKKNSGYVPCIVLSFRIKKDLQEVGSSQFPFEWSNLSNYINIFNNLKIFEEYWYVNISHGSKNQRYQPLDVLLIHKSNDNL